MSEQSNYYQLLGVDRNATQDEINKAFRKKAQQWHPDRHQNDREQASEMFKQINEAHDVLSNPEKKNIYDQFGSDGLKEGGVPPFMRNPFMGSPFQTQFQDFFGQMFGHAEQNDNERRYDINMDEKINLSDVFTDTHKSIKIERHMFCNECSGTGSRNKKTSTCPVCNGTGIMTNIRRHGIMQELIRSECNKCKGRGKIHDGPVCNICNGLGSTNKSETIEFTIPSGTINGETIKINGKGHQINNNYYGNLNIHINIDNNNEQLLYGPFNIKGYSTDPHDLLLKLHINIAESLCGFNKKVEHPSKQKSINVCYDKSVHTSDLFVLRGEGLPYKNNHQFGNIYVIIIVDNTQNLDDSQKKIIWETLNKTPYVHHEGPTNCEKFDPQF